MTTKRDEPQFNNPSEKPIWWDWRWGLPDDYLQIIGEIVVATSWLESQVEMAIWQFLAPSRRNLFIHEGHAVTTGLRTSGKLKMLKTLATLHLHEPEREQLARIIGDIRTVTKKRDNVVHGWLKPVLRDNEITELQDLRVRADEAIRLQAVRFTAEAFKSIPKEVQDAGIALINFMRAVVSSTSHETP